MNINVAPDNGFSNGFKNKNSSFPLKFWKSDASFFH